MAKGKLEADKTIEQRNAELASLREELAARARLEEVIDRLTSRERQEDHIEDPYRESDNRSSQPAITRASQEAISPDAIERLIENKITNRDKERTAQQNRETVKAKLKEIYGADYTKRLEDRAEELGLDKSTLNDLAARSPTAFLELVSPKASGERPFTPPRSSRSSDLDLSNTTQARPGTKAFYDQIKKSDPDKYWSPKVQWAMHQDAIKAAKEGRDF